MGFRLHRLLLYALFGHEFLEVREGTLSEMQTSSKEKIVLKSENSM